MESPHLVDSYTISNPVGVCEKLSFIVFKSFDIAQKCHEQHLVLNHCCHAHILFYFKHTFFNAIAIEVV